MKKIVIIITTFWCLTSYGIGLQEYGVEAINAANLVLQPGVEKCLSQFKQGGGVPQINEIDYISNVDTELYIIEGTTTFGDVMAGSWTIKVTPQVSEFSEEATVYLCEITELLESSVIEKQ